MSVIQQSGVIPYRIQKQEAEVLLITSSSGKRWGIPKGMIECFMSAADSAAKEAWEEAGIVGTVIIPAIGHYQAKKWGLTCRIEVFLMQVETIQLDFPEAGLRQREWLSIPKAIERIQDADLKRLFEGVRSFYQV
jgi:8-oxo-dGTP pyrophosphatase MutT (NUDIX family)